jgi:hypothetical protein
LSNHRVGAWALLVLGLHAACATGVPHTRARPRPEAVPAVAYDLEVLEGGEGPGIVESSVLQRAVRRVVGESNLARHGRRMAGEFFRMLTFWGRGCSSPRSSTKTRPSRTSGWS